MCSKLFSYYFRLFASNFKWVYFGIPEWCVHIAAILWMQWLPSVCEERWIWLAMDSGQVESHYVAWSMCNRFLHITVIGSHRRCTRRNYSRLATLQWAISLFLNFVFFQKLLVAKKIYRKRVKYRWLIQFWFAKNEIYIIR